MNFPQLPILILSFLLFSCNNKPKQETQEETEEHTQEETLQSLQNKGHELIYNMSKKVGDYKTLMDKKDVTYTYSYQTPDGKSDISTEKYIFDGELSYGLYKKHERTFPDLVGSFEQGYDGNNFWLKHKGEIIKDSVRLKRVAFNRPTNFYWFTMFQKLLDPGLNYEYLGDELINNISYDVVKVTFNSIDKTPTDIYQLYINKKTSLVDQFLFTVADFGVVETPYLMTLKYETIDGILIPTQRQYKKSTWNADVSEEPWIYVTWSNIKFQNDLNKDLFKE